MPRHAFKRLAGLCLSLVLAAAALPAATVWAQAAEQGPSWTELSPAHRAALAPLGREWRSVGADQKQKWLEIATRFPSMSADERQRIQVRMAEWARLTPQERGQARLNFQQAKQVPSEDRQARWQAYQSLPAEQKRQFAARAASAAPQGEPVRRAASPALRRGSDDPDTPRIKSNLVPNPAYATPPKPVAPTVVQAQPGATTTLISKPASPPAHNQTGLPKIAATPGFVDKATLLPQRGPQGAAVQSAAASDANRR